MQNKKRFFVILSVFFAIISLVLGSYVANQNAKKNQNKKTVQSSVGSQDKNLSRLFYDEEYVFLSQEFSDALLNEVEKKLGDVTNDQKRILEEARLKWELLQETKKLYDQTLLKGNSRNHSAKLREDVTELEIERFERKLVESEIRDGFSEKIHEILREDILSIDDSSASQKETAENLMDKLVKDGQVVQGFTLEDYQAGKKAVADLPSSDEKEDYEKDLELIEEVLTNMGISY